VRVATVAAPQAGNSGERVTRRDLQCAVEDLLASKAAEVLETESLGCAIVW
jgi:hypothetical protein